MLENILYKQWAKENFPPIRKDTRIFKKQVSLKCWLWIFPQQNKLMPQSAENQALDAGCNRKTNDSR